MKGLTMLQLHLLFTCLALATIFSVKAQDIDLIPPRKKEQHPLLSTTEQKQSISLFKAYPGLIEKIPHVSLATLPTPVQKLSTLSDIENSTNIFIKRDDQISTFIGGSMVRKLEFLLGEALFAKAKCVVTTSFAGSNHVMATAAYCRQIGLPCIACLTQHKSSQQTQKNLIATHALGCELRHYKSTALLNIDLVNIGRQQKAEIGISPYFIPRGCSNKVGIIGFINAAFELKEQIGQGLIPTPDIIYVALGSSGAAAGLLAGLQAAGLSSKVIAIRALSNSSFAQYHKNKTLNLGKEAIDYLSERDEQFKRINITDDRFEVYDDFSGQESCFISAKATQIIKNLELIEGIKFDEAFTRKAFAALLHDLASGKLQNKTVLFWDSFCSETFSDIIQNIDYKSLPTDFHHYFETTLQTEAQGV